MRTQKTQLQKHTDKIRMRGAERRDLRARIVSYMEYHPLASQVLTTKKEVHGTARAATGVAGFQFIQTRVFNYRFRVIGSFFAVLLIVGIPFAAEHAVPGDTLYPVKVRFNEEVRSQLSLTPYQKVAWETRVVERRIAEARLLASEGKLTEEVQAVIEEDVRAHTEAAQKELAELHENDADEAVVAQVVFESALDVQTAVLDASDGQEVEGLTEIVKAAKEEVSTEPDFASSTPSYETFIARVETETTRARELFDAIDDTATDGEKEQVLARIEEEEQAIQAAAEVHENGDTETAVFELRHVLLNIQKIIVFMTDIDVRSTVAFEALVPKALTPEEHKALLEESLAAVRVIQGMVIERAPEVTDEALIEEVAVGMEALDTLIVSIEEALEAEDLAETERLVTNALVLAHDLDVLTAPVEEGEVTEEGAVGEEEAEGQVESAETEVSEGSTENVVSDDEEAASEEVADTEQEEPAPEPQE